MFPSELCVERFAINDGFSLERVQFSDEGILIIRVFTGMSGRDFFKNSSLDRRKRMPLPSLHQELFTRTELQFLTIQIDVNFSAEDMECLFFFLMTMDWMRLAWQNSNQLFAIFSIDNIDDNAPYFFEFLHPVVMRDFNVEFRTKMDSGFIQHSFDLMQNSSHVGHTVVGALFEDGRIFTIVLSCDVSRSIFPKFSAGQLAFDRRESASLVGSVLVTGFPTIA